ncbi:MAG: hypothetical protein ACSLFQ_03655 [Thermoanaerobaculia bacterium]
MIDEELRSLLAAMRDDQAAANADTRRHFDVANEATRHELHLVAEAVAQGNEKLDRRAIALDEAIQRTAAETQAMIKFSHDELQRPVRTLENSVANLQ